MFIAGADIFIWLKLLWQNKFKIPIRYWPKTIMITVISLFLSPLALIEYIIYNHQIKKVKISHPPIFILGHWRNGTTFLQELLAQDKDQFAYVNLVESIFPRSFLTFYRFLRWVLSKFLPEKRPMDNMKLYPEFPAEHDWAISNLCLMSPYTAAYFPKNKDFYQRYAPLEDISQKEKEKWTSSLTYFLKKISKKYDNKQIILKSPHDTYRIKILLEVFPDAKFIHIHRNPYEVFYSTVKLWQKNRDIFVLQDVEEDLEQLTFELYTKMYNIFLKDVSLIPSKNFFEVSYERLREEPLEVMKEIYQYFDLENFENAKYYFKKYLDPRRGYKPQRYSISFQDKQRIYDQWHETIDLWGYEKPSQIINKTN